MGKLEKCLYIVELLSRGKPLSLKEINEHWQYSSLYDDEIIAKTFGRYKEYISDVFAIDIEYDMRAKKYYIANFDYIKNNSLYKYLLSAFHVQGLMELAMKHREQLVLEAASSGVEYLHTILEAIDRKVSIEFDYHSFNRQTVTHHECIPCFLKTWEQRWYLVAEPLNRKNPTVYALERISNLRLTEQCLEPSSHIAPQSYFEGCYGVNHEDCAPMLITIKVYGAQVDYIKARPIHSSQEEVEQGDGWSLFSYWLRPSYNFYQALLWHREKLEVIGPESVREEMKRIVSEILRLYNIYE
ncbi:MAG: helix-turn-helix transcriptional regulator [Bacteroides stercoris]